MAFSRTFEFCASVVADTNCQTKSIAIFHSLPGFIYVKMKRVFFSEVVRVSTLLHPYWPVYKKEIPVSYDTYKLKHSYSCKINFPYFKNKNKYSSVSSRAGKTRSWCASFHDNIKEQTLLQVLDESTAECSCFRSMDVLLRVIGGCRVKVPVAGLNGIQENGCQLFCW